MLWYERPAQPHIGMKRSHASLDPYGHGMIDYYGQMAPKYMKPEPVAYYQYADDPERYQANITVSVQHPTYAAASSSSLAYTPSNHYSYSSTPNLPTNPNTLYYSSAADSSNAAAAAYSCTSPCSNNACTDPRAMNSCSPVISSAEPEPNSIQDPQHVNTPLTPPLSVSPNPVGTPHCVSPIPATTATTYFEKENTIGYRSGSTSPSMPDCDSTNAELLDGSVIPKLPLQMLSDLSEGLPLPGTCM